VLAVFELIARERARTNASRLARAGSLPRRSFVSRRGIRTRGGTAFAILERRQEQSMSDVRSKSLGKPTLYTLILGGLYLSYLVLSPFFAALTWAVMFAILFHGMQAALARRIGPNRAAVVTTLFVAFVIVAPAALLISTVAREAPQIADYLKHSSQQAPGQIHRIWDAVRARVPLPMPEDPTEFMNQGVKRAVSFLAPIAGAFVKDSLAGLGTLAVMLFALFFMLRDGDTLSRGLCDRLPFSEHENERLLSETRDLVTASFGAGAIVAAAQGFIAGVAFWLLGVGPPMFWGVFTAFCSLLPVVGATIVWVPAGIALLLSGETTRGVLMLLIGAFGISGVDNWLRPLLLSGKTSVSGFVVFFGLLGGAAAFGLIGLVIGPIILVITAQLLDNLRAPNRLAESEVSDDRTSAGSRVA
jgi:predicted PurR-regulated permease PerM